MVIHMASSSPVNAGNYIPHKSPVKMVDAIIEWNDDEKSSLVSAGVPVDSPFVNSFGIVDNECLLEIIAQAAAAQHGFNLFRDGQPEEQGFIAGVNFMKITEPVHVNEPLFVSVKCGTEISSLSVVNGIIRSRNGRLKAEAAITVWHGHFSD
jgi:predicted hotdog family 3-hydroxylacyl-ACP dehydratase